MSVTGMLHGTQAQQSSGSRVPEPMVAALPPPPFLEAAALAKLPLTGLAEAHILAAPPPYNQPGIVQQLTKKEEPQSQYYPHFPRS